MVSEWHFRKHLWRNLLCWQTPIKFIERTQFKKKFCRIITLFEKSLYSKRVPRSDFKSECNFNNCTFPSHFQRFLVVNSACRYLIDSWNSVKSHKRNVFGVNTQPYESVPHFHQTWETVLKDVVRPWVNANNNSAFSSTSS